jgi:hypothetical protein
MPKPSKGPLKQLTATVDPETEQPEKIDLTDAHAIKYKLDTTAADVSQQITEERFFVYQRMWKDVERAIRRLFERLGHPPIVLPPVKTSLCMIRSPEAAICIRSAPRWQTKHAVG